MESVHVRVIHLKSGAVCFLEPCSVKVALEHLEMRKDFGLGERLITPEEVQSRLPNFLREDSFLAAGTTVYFLSAMLRSPITEHQLFRTPWQPLIFQAYPDVTSNLALLFPSRVVVWTGAVREIRKMIAQADRKEARFEAYRPPPYGFGIICEQALSTPLMFGPINSLCVDNHKTGRSDRKMNWSQGAQVVGSSRGKAGGESITEGAKKRRANACPGTPLVEGLRRAFATPPKQWEEQKLEEASMYGDYDSRRGPDFIRVEAFDKHGKRELADAAVTVKFPGILTTRERAGDELCPLVDDYNAGVKEVVNAVGQAHGYACFVGYRNLGLSSWRETYIARRQLADPQVLEIAGPFMYDDVDPTAVAALAFMQRDAATQSDLPLEITDKGFGKAPGLVANNYDGLYVKQETDPRDDETSDEEDPTADKTELDNGKLERSGLEGGSAQLGTELPALKRQRSGDASDEPPAREDVELRQTYATAPNLNSLEKARTTGDGEQGVLKAGVEAQNLSADMPAAETVNTSEGACKNGLETTLANSERAHQTRPRTRPPRGRLGTWAAQNWRLEGGTLVVPPPRIRRLKALPVAELHRNGALGTGKYGIVERGCIGGIPVAVKLTDVREGLQDMPPLVNEVLKYNRLAELQGSVIPELVWAGWTMAGGIYGVATTLIEGLTSDDVRWLTPDEREKCRKSAERGLKRIHKLGVVHNDVRPENLVVVQRNRVVFMDFGNAQLSNNEADRLSDLRELRYVFPRSQR